MTFKRRRIATLDLGTNSLLMLIAERDEEGRLTLLADESSVPRLGEGLRATQKITPQAIERVMESVLRFTAQAKEMKADEIILVATSAAREATNTQDLLDQLAQVEGLKAEVILPNEEARLTYMSVTTEREGEHRSMVVDIGGGSTEITWGIGHRFDGGRSLKIGTVKLLEGPLAADPPPAQALEHARTEIDRQLDRVTPLGDLERYYGTAGSFTHLAAIDLEMTTYHPEKIAGHRLTPERIQAWIRQFSSMTKEECLKIPGVDPRRVDVLLGGTLIIERLFRKFGNPYFEVYDRGVRFGKLFDHVRKFTLPIVFA